MDLGLIIQRRSHFPLGGWPECSGIGGRNGPEWVAGINRNQWPECVGIRNKAGEGPKLLVFYTSQLKCQQGEGALGLW